MNRDSKIKIVFYILIFVFGAIVSAFLDFLIFKFYLFLANS